MISSKVTVHGAHEKGDVVWDTSKEPKSKNACSNALHTIWDAKFQRNDRVIHNKELAVLNFALTEVGYPLVRFPNCHECHFQ